MKDSVDSIQATHAAFMGSRLLVKGSLSEVSTLALETYKKESKANILVFDNDSGKTVDLDRRGLSAEPARGPGRPKLGVIAREVTLLPRHWDWLSEQPGGASIALRKLVEEARRSSEGVHRMRRAQEATYNFLTTMAGDEPGFEEALRALYRRDEKRFKTLIKSWPKDVSAHARVLSASAFQKVC